MATAKTDTLLETDTVKASEQPTIGGYAASAYSDPRLAIALEKPPASKTSGSVDFADADKRWLKEVGISTSEDKQKPIVNLHPKDQRWLKDIALTTSREQDHVHNWESAQQRERRMHRPWNSSYGGRLAIRSVSRGVVGAAFFTMANIGLRNAMEGYTRYGDIEKKGILQHIARIIDNTVGEGIYRAGKLFNPGEERLIDGKLVNLKARKWITFRDTVTYSGHLTPGRSLGSEVVNVTFDFASMSFGDYMTRYVLTLIDPNAHKAWMKDGHIDIPAACKDVITNVFRGVTYAAGEDMAVAIPYVYGLKAQRNIINKYSPGFKYDSDLSLNGSSIKVKDGKVVGDYQLEGALDEMGRFSWYNVGTKIFRDAYSAIETKVSHWWHGDRKLHMPHIDAQSLAPKAMALSAVHGVRYLVRTTLKVMTYMLPSTALFFITRTPQTRVRGAAIDISSGKIVKDFAGHDVKIKEGDAIGIYAFEPVSKKPRAKKEGVPQASAKPAASANQSLEDSLDQLESGASAGKTRFITPNSAHDSTINPHVDISSTDEVTIKKGHEKNFYILHSNEHGVPTKIRTNEYHQTGNRKDAINNNYYERSQTEAPWYNKISNPIAKACHSAGTGVFKGLRNANNFFKSKLGFGFFKPADSQTAKMEHIEKFARIYTNAAISYTPYFMAKTDILSAAFDTDRTDMAIDRMLNGAGNLNWGEFKAGWGEIRRAGMLEPFTDPKRETIAQAAHWTADPEHGSNEAYMTNGVALNQPYVIDTEGKKIYATDDLKTKPINTLTQLKSRPSSWAAQEAMRQFQDADTQGKSVH